MFILLGILAYEDYKSRYVHMVFVHLLVLLGITSAIFSFLYYPYTYNDLIVIGIVSVLSIILILRKEMSEADIGFIAVAMIVPYLTAIAFLFYSVFVLISFLKGNSTMPAYTLFFVGILLATIFYSSALISPHTCGVEIDNLLIDKYELGCSNPFTIIITQETFTYIPKEVNYSMNTTFNFSSV